MATVTLSNNKQFSCSQETTILDSAKQQGITLEHSCRTGKCGACKAKVISGNTQNIKSEGSLTLDELNEGYILTCARTVTTDLSLDIEDLGRFASIKIQISPCRIDSIHLLSIDVIQVVLRIPPQNNFNYIPGQYIDIIAKNGSRRSYSIANAYKGTNKLELHIRKIENGELSYYWFNAAKINDLLRFEGPFGTFCLREKPQKNIVFLATGTGIAPIKSILEDLDNSNKKQYKIFLYWGGRYPQDIYWQPKFKNIQVNFTPTLSRATPNWSGHFGYVQEACIKDQIDLFDSIVYACGSDQMIHSAKSLLISSGLDTKNFFSDAFVSSIK